MLILSANSVLAQEFIGTASLHLELSECNVNVDVSPGSSGVVALSGNINYSYYYKMALYISARIDGTDIEHWGIGVTPNRYVGAGNGTLPLQIYIHVPRKTDDKIAGTGIIHVDGIPYGWGEPFITIEAQTIISVMPYYEFSAYSKEVFKEVSPGTITYFTIIVHNLGNTNDVYELKQLSETKNFVVNFEKSSLAINEKDADYVYVRVVTPRGWTIWEDKIIKIDVSVVSKCSGEIITVPIYLRLRGTYMPFFDVPQILLLILFVGGVVKCLKKS